MQGGGFAVGGAAVRIIRTRCTAGRRGFHRTVMRFLKNLITMPEQQRQQQQQVSFPPHAVLLANQGVQTLATAMAALTMDAADPEDCYASHFLNMCTQTLTILFNAATSPWSTIDIDPALLRLDRNGLFRTRITLPQQLLLRDNECYAESLLFAVAYGKHLLALEGPGELEAFALYKPPRDPAAQETVLLMLQRARYDCDARVETVVQAAVDAWMSTSPQIAAVVMSQAVEGPPIRSAKDRHCVFPGCSVTGAGLYNGMSKCGRCRAVYYCSEEHQREHWDEHKKSCVKVSARRVEDGAGAGGEIGDDGEE